MTRRLGSPASRRAGILLGTVALAGSLVAGCAGPDSEGGAAPTESPSEPTETGSPTLSPSPKPTRSATPEPTVTPAPGERPAGAAARDLAERLGVGEDDVRVVRAIEVTWSDTSAGCPIPGMSYAQVLTDGTLVELEVDGRRYEYHSRQGGGLFLCRNPQAPVSIHG